MSITDLFQNKISDFLNGSIQTTPTATPQESTDFEQGYLTSNLDLLLQRARKYKSVRENKIFDLIQVENDPNYNRGTYENRSGGALGKLVGKLSMSTQLMTMINSLTYMAKVQEFLPENLRNLLQNFQSIADTGVNLITNIEQQVTFGAIERAFFQDLKFQFMGKTITFSQITQMALSIEQNLPLVENIKNNGLRSILSLNLQQFLPSEFMQIFDAVQWVDQLYDVFNGLELENFFDLEEYNINVYNRMQTYLGNPIDQVVADPSAYYNFAQGFSDPFGLTLQTAFLNEIQEGYIQELTIALNEEALALDLNIPPEYIEQFVAIQQVHIQEALIEASSGGTALPSLPAVVNNINIESYNGTVTAINSAFENVAIDILSTLGITNIPSGTRPLDYLSNLKANIKSRLEMERLGASSDNFVAINTYLESILPGKTIDDAFLRDMNNKIDTLLGE